jgi:hypothetical protein
MRNAQPSSPVFAVIAGRADPEFVTGIRDQTGLTLWK